MEKRFQRRTMSVPEMRRLLGLGKTEAYWLVKKGGFKYICNAKSGRRIRIMLDSFEEWYSNQFHYSKVVGNPPGANWTGSTISISEMAGLLGISTSAVYSILEKGVVKTELVAGTIRIYKDSFEEWYAGQHFYQKVQEDNHPDKELFKQTISTKEAADRLGIPREKIYYYLKSHCVETVKLDGRIRIVEKSFEEHFKANRPSSITKRKQR